ncbi:non-ribosomal peptide synthetase/type I polyketide synthase [Alteromonas sp. ASW11-130]|uniref:non-ribosomal peptide synthetase/type I polyketide synthase n=1 Tax=Alteromonas sp. ASW11-130 TaxID=3015775 RepID=UPI0022418DED|nr:non-ribosomal peptide synthetase/type I polyketide synthase [Alteromonas sp. ASW11-130]MCW8093481.1 amino acid adenylation domain-containing protein [Alteromonas sp. ASW11-130]
MAKANELFKLLKDKGIHAYLDNGKLKTKSEPGAITAELAQQIKQNKDELIRYLEQAHCSATAQSIPKRADEKYSKVTANQKNIWLKQNLDKSTTAYNVCTAVRMTGVLVQDALEKALQTVAERHQVLNACFVEQGGELKMMYSAVNASLLRRISSTNFADAKKKVDELSQQPFDLSEPNLFKPYLVQIGDTNEYIFLLCIHHIITDGWSNGVLFKELELLYNSFTRGIQLDLPEPKLQFGDYVDWIESSQEQEQIEHGLEQWAEMLSDLPPVHSLPLDGKRVVNLRNELSVCGFQLDIDLLNMMKQQAMKLKVSHYVLLEAALALTFSRWSDEKDIVIGTSASGRNHPELESVLGFFVNPLILCNHVNPELSTESYISQTMSALSNALKLQAVPFDQIVSHVVKSGSSSHSPIFQIMFDYQKVTPNVLDLDNLECELLPTESNEAKFDIEVTISEFDEGLNVRWNFAAQLFNDATITSMHNSYVEVLTALCSTDNRMLKDIPLVSHQQVSATRNFPYDDPASFIEQFERAAELYPENIAVQSEEIKLSYEEVNSRANRMAFLMRSMGADVNKRVGIFVEPSVEMLIAILACLKSSAAYVPIDTEYPEDRIEFILEDSEVSIVLTNQEVVDEGTFCDYQVLPVDLEVQDTLFKSLPNTNLTAIEEPLAQAIAYVLYTSGSTGRPKGVAINQLGLANYLSHAQQYMSEQHVGAVVSSSIGFDATITSLLTPLTLGKTVSILAKGLDATVVGLKYYLFDDGQSWLFKMTPAHLDALGHECKTETTSSLQHMFIIGGEQLNYNQLKSWQKNWFPDAIYVNEYGPTESVVGCSTYVVKDQIPDELSGPVPIGEPIQNTEFFVIKDEQLVPEGGVGELYINSVGLANGYLNLEKKNKESFVSLNCEPLSGIRLYKTGDTVKLDSQRQFWFIGRDDDQVKVNGYRIEMAEIESAILAASGVEGVAVVSQKSKDRNFLVAYVVNSDLKTDTQTFLSGLKSEVAKKLADYMVPPIFELIEALPLTSNQKVDKDSLPKIDIEERLGLNFVAPTTNLQTQLCDIWKNALEVDRVGIKDNFMELGGNSILFIKLRSEIEEKLNLKIDITAFFEFPTIETFCQHIQDLINGDGNEELQNKIDTHELDELDVKDTCAVAVVAMSGRFPGAASVTQLWDNILNSDESLTLFSKKELLDVGYDENTIDRLNFVNSAGLVDCDVKTFDANFFDMTPREAEVLDPQYRLIFECAVETLESAGYGDFSKGLNCGAFVGCGESQYLFRHLFPNADIMQNLGLAVMHGTSNNYLATRLAYKLNLRGPSVNVATACSTSLVSIHQAVNSIRLGECEMALAGGAGVSEFEASGYLYQSGGIESPDGHCRAFDKGANGTRGGNGAGLVLLKNLDAAIRDGNEVLAVIRGSAINNDGALKAGYTAPSVQGQSQVILKALKQSRFDAGEIQYVETHGTGTPLGDPIEVKALSYAFSGADKQNCALGTLKPNIGHLDSAAGVAGFIKATLALKNRVIPPSINFKEANNLIDFENSPFYIATQSQAWPVQEGATRKAGVSAFGIGGTNVHMILEEAPEINTAEKSAHFDCYHMFPISAKDAQAFADQANNLHSFINDNTDVCLADVAHTLQKGRGEYNFRHSLVAKDVVGLQAELEKASPSQVTQEIDNMELVFLLSGQGSQYKNVAKGLIEQFDTFKTSFEKCRELFLEQEAHDVLALLEASDEELEKTACAQPLLFSIEYAMAQLLKSWGIEARRYLGHSLGELVAACLAEVFSLEDAVKVVARRAHLMQQAQSGSMLVVKCAVDTLNGIWDKNSVSISAYNGPHNLVVGGTDESIHQLQDACEQAGIESQLVRTSHAFHTSMMKDASEQFKQSFTDITLSPPKTEFMSNVTGEYITNEQACDPQYWASQITSAVHFSQNIEHLAQDAKNKGVSLVLMELGPGNTLTNLVRRHTQGHNINVVNLIRHPKQQMSDVAHLYKGLSQIWNKGYPLDWEQLSGKNEGKIISLPTYPFNRKKYWIDRLSRKELLGMQRDPAATENWFYQANWKLAEPSRDDNTHDDTQTLYVCRNESLLSQLQSGSCIKGNAILVDACDMGKAKAYDFDHDIGVVTLDPLQDEHCINLVNTLMEIGRLNLVYCESSLGSQESEDKPTHESDFIALIGLVKAFVKLRPMLEVDLHIATNQVFRVDGNEEINADAALLRGICKVTPQEFSGINCFHLDFGYTQQTNQDALQRLSTQLCSEVVKKNKDKEVAFRGNGRWLRNLTPFDNERSIEAGEVNLPPGSHYFITGGLGNIGITLAKWLAEERAAKVTLLSRRGIDSVTQLPKLENGQLQVIQGDVGDYESLSDALEQAREQFGDIHGVIHAAGNIHDSVVPLVETDLNVCSQQFVSKVNGLLNLEKALTKHNVQTCVLMSSLAVELGGLGFTAYAAANAYMDAFCQKKQNEGSAQWISINWDGWAFGADVAASPASLTAEDGVKAMSWVWNNMHSGVVINSKTSLSERVKKWVDFEDDESGSLSLYERPEISEAYCAPTSDTQQALISLWQEVLGIANLGINDNFFELGGDSLLSTRLVGNICKRFNVSDEVFSLKDFFAEPTVSSIASRIDSFQLTQSITAKRKEMLTEREEVEEGVF